MTYNYMLFELRRIGLKQVELAFLLGVTRATVCRWYNGKTNPNLKNRYLLEFMYNNRFNIFFTDLHTNIRKKFYK